MTVDGMEFEPSITGGIVVGWDGSELADRALKWAVAEADYRDCPVHVIRAWTLTSAIAETDVPFGSVPSYPECAEAVAARVSAAVAGLGDGRAIHQHIVHGPVAQTLLAAAAHADLLVVGRRGHGGFLGLRLGSVADQVVRHSPCTVVVAQ
ncbi:MAG: universal stress protein [Actinomycetota bacterium]